MADYDLALCLYRTWFEYDVARKAKPGIVSSWTFDRKTGVYTFNVAAQARWSDGQPILAKHLLNGLRRAVSLKTPYGESIRAIMRLEAARATAPQTLEIPTSDGGPSEMFFQRMGSIFLAPMHPDDVGPDGTAVSNARTSGPYRVASHDEKRILLHPNAYDILATATRPASIEIRLNSPPDLESFVKGASWSNIMQTATLMSPELAGLILTQKLPFWSRGHDRVSLLRPVGNGSVLRHRQALLRAAGRLWQTMPVTGLPFNSAKARSLQPRGYPLFQELDFSQMEDSPRPGAARRVVIVTSKAAQFDYQRPFIDAIWRQQGIEVDWRLCESLPEAFASAAKNSDIDFVLLGFGVADPEPATWMGLVVAKGSVFADISARDLAEFKRISALNSKGAEVRGFRALLASMGHRGSYLPLFHYSTLSVARPGISFENIHELDETVDYSKLVLQ